ncbi:MAG: plastocyanin/azurin family copper-binding protein [Chloroflexota bacterium]
MTLNDTFTMEPASMTVPAGVPVTFVVTNAGAIVHEFYLGDETAQSDHEEEMMAGGMQHGEPNGISLQPGETKELTHTFEAAGQSLAGCHEAGHYAAGMKATITVSG